MIKVEKDFELVGKYYDVTGDPETFICADFVRENFGSTPKKIKVYLVENKKGVYKLFYISNSGWGDILGIGTYKSDYDVWTTDISLGQYLEKLELKNKRFDIYIEELK